MKRTTVKLPDELDSRLRREAERRGMTISELTREAIEAHLGGSTAPRRHFAWAGMISSEDGTLSRRVDEIVQEVLRRA